MTLKTALAQGIKLLEEGAIPAPRLTAEVLLCHAVGCDKIRLFSHPEETLTELAWIHYGRYLHERLQGKPTQYITKRQEFYGRDFFVCPAVLIPRPETEHLVEAALAMKLDGRDVIDIGTGSGAIAVTLALESEARVRATDLSHDALLVATRNARTLGAGVSFVCADLLPGIRPRSFDVVVSNPPYIPRTDREGIQREVRDYEPELALYGGPDGNQAYARLIPQAAEVLRPGGYLLLELGYKSLEAVQAMLGPEWREVQVHADLAGLPRVLSACYRGG